MPDGLITPGLVLQVAEATQDYRITPTEFNEIMGSLSSIVARVLADHIGNTELRILESSLSIYPTGVR